MSNFRKKSSGFVLIETAIAVITLSICIGSMMLFIRKSNENQKVKITKANLSAAQDTLSRFYALNGYIPCPSLPRLDDGVALEKCQGAVEQIGIIPYKTLGISSSLAKDGYGHMLTYAVSEHATFKKDILNTVTSNELELRGRKSEPYGKGIDGFAYIMISHGPTGSGAFTLSNNRFRFPTRTQFEAENASDSFLFYVDLSPIESCHEVVFSKLSDLMPKTLLEKSSSSFQNEKELMMKKQNNPYFLD
jgi:hypothetical protein